MLGQTAKWLRLLGIDAEYASDEIEDSTLLERAKEEERFIITRDKTLGKSERGFLVPKAPAEEVVSMILSHFDLKPNPLSRCSICNSPIHRIDKETVIDKVPKGVYSRQDEFWRCAGCEQIYWKGTHWDKILSTIEKIKED